MLQAGVGVVALGFGLFLDTLLVPLERRLPCFPLKLRCPVCGAPLSAACGCRRGRIPWRYVLLPLLCAAAAIGTESLPVRLWPTVWVLAGVLLVGAFVDASVHRLPNRLLYPGAAALVVARLVLPPSFWLQSVFGLVVVGALAAGVALLSRGGLGGGDVKAAAVMGLALGPLLGILAFSLAGAACGAAAVGLVVAGKKTWRDSLAFGPYLCVGALSVAMLAPTVLHVLP